MAASLSGGRWWRTAFLTLRDETFASPLPHISQLLQNVIFSHYQTLLSAASDLPTQEVASDLSFLLESVANASHDGDAQCMTPICIHTCKFIHDVSYHATLQINSSYWTLILDSYTKLLDFLIRIPSNKLTNSLNANDIALRMASVKDCFETLSNLSTLSHGTRISSDYIHLVTFLLHIIQRLHSDLVFSYCSSSGNRSYTDNAGKELPNSSIWEVLALAFTMLAESFSGFGSSFGVELWQSTFEVFRKMIDVLAFHTLLVEANVMSRFYTSLLHCLHVVLIDPKCSISDHVSSFVSVLRMFFVYGLTSRPQISCHDAHKGNELGSVVLKWPSEPHKRTDHTHYVPPHLRKKERLYVKQVKSRDSQSLSELESSMVDLASSDSDCSDSDGSLKDSDRGGSSKVRVAAIICLQDLCQADRTSVAAQWTILLPTNDVLKPRKFEATLMTCLIFDPHVKVRMAAASTLAVMLDGPSSMFLQVAEYRETSKYGSYMALSSSLGLILMELHTGILFLIQHETQSRLLGLLFKILMLLTSCTPYSRMPGDLLPRVIASLNVIIEEGVPSRNDQTGLLVGAISCLTAALSTSPPLPQVRKLLSEEILNDFDGREKTSGALTTIFKFSEHITSPTTCYEALLALRAISHNYPNLMASCWQRVSALIYKLLRAYSPEVSARTWKGQTGNTVGFIGEKLIAGAIKVLDECLRGISGFKGTEDLLDDKLYDTPFTHDCIRTKRVSSAPSYGLENSEDAIYVPKTSLSGSKQWSEALEKHLPIVLDNSSAMVRAASVTCFAGITSSVFFSLAKKEKSFTISSVINAALHDESPLVRSAACRAIGVISCFPETYQSSEILQKLIHAVETNTCDSLLTVRVAASWALANVCDSIRHCISDSFLEESRGSIVNDHLIELLTECALHLTKDSDKVKSNAVRALGNIARCLNITGCSVYNEPLDSVSTSLRTNHVKSLPSDSIKGSFTSESSSCHPAFLGHSCLLEKMVQAFLSCVSTGNVKVQWNVCHAFSNLFLNRTIEVQYMDWAPSVFNILLVLLRDSSNFKIRIQAAAALSAPASANDYGKSFSDVVQGVEQILENLGSDQVSAPSNFKYMIMLEKQLTSTMLHVLSIASSSGHQPLEDFLVKKASYFEDWFKSLLSSLRETRPDVENSSVTRQKKEIILNAVESLTEVYNGNRHHSIAQRFKQLRSIQ